MMAENEPQQPRDAFAPVESGDPKEVGNACFVDGQAIADGNAWDIYAIGYSMQAEAGINALLRGNNGDYLVYPILFCYRHYLELRLKQLIIAGAELYDQNLTAPNRHNLIELWDAIYVPILHETWSSDLAHRDFERAGDVIGWFNEFDPSSEAFRYPIGKSGRLLPKSSLGVNLISVREAMAEVTITLDAVSGEILMHLDAARDHRKRYGSP